MRALEHNLSEEGVSENDRYLEFDLGPEHYAVPLLHVKEVIPIPETTKIPRAPSYFLGVMNLRGHIISIIDLRAKLSIKPKTENLEEAVIIVDLKGVQIGIIVDSINKVLAVTKTDVSEVPEISAQVNAKYISGIHRQEKYLTVLLDLAGVLDINDIKIINEKNKAA